MARVTIHLLSENVVVVAAQRPLRLYELERDHEEARLECIPRSAGQVHWRLDNDEVASVFVRLRKNLMGAHWLTI